MPTTSSTKKPRRAVGRPAPTWASLAAAAAGAGVAPGAALGPDGYAAAEQPPAAAVVEQRRLDEHQALGRNDPCWCGSGKKFKKCHGA